MEDQGYECRYFWDQIHRNGLDNQLQKLNESIIKKWPHTKDKFGTVKEIGTAKEIRQWLNQYS